MPYQLITAPTELPVSMADLKNQCAIDHNALDGRMDDWIAAATLGVEWHLERALITQTRKEFFSGFHSDAFQVSGPPLQSVTHIKYYDINDTVATVPSTLYDVDTVSEPGIIRLKWGKSWPAAILRPTNPVEIQYVCGYGGASAVPPPIKQAILMLAASYVRNREAETNTLHDFKILQAHNNILRQYRKTY